jgi:hypothetical protein
MTAHRSRGTVAGLGLMLLAMWSGCCALGCDAADDRTPAPEVTSPSTVNPPPAVAAEPDPSSRNPITPANVAPGAAPVASASPSDDARPREGAAARAARGSPRAAAEYFLAALRRRDAVALAGVLAPGKDGTAEERVAQTLGGKGKLRSLDAALRQGIQLAPGVEVRSKPEDGREVVKVALDLTDARGVTHEAAAALEVFKFDDGWRVDDFDRTGGNWPR